MSPETIPHGSSRWGGRKNVPSCASPSRRPRPYNTVYQKSLITIN